MSQQKRPHKRYTPKFFHCDDVPRQTISSAIPELVSVTESSLATSRSNSKPEKALSGGDPDFINVRPSALPGWDLRPISSRAAISDIRIRDEFAKVAIAQKAS
jgi:hypothetical protein